jgi:hypothetical protein
MPSLRRKEKALTSGGVTSMESGIMSPREKHIKEMRRLEEAIEKTKSEKLKKDYGKALNRMRHELKIYDSYRRQK